MTKRLRFVIGVFLIALVSTATRADQVPAFRQIMQKKLQHSQAILAAVVTSNWTLLDRECQALVALTRDPAWAPLNTPEHVSQSDAFVGSLRKLIEASSRKDLDAASTAEVSLIMSCIQCHKDMARRRFAR